MPFHFVDNSVIDRKARKLIRSHVMKGKNVGKTRTPRIKAGEPTTRKTTAVDEGKPSHNGNETSSLSESTVIAITRQVGNDLSFISFPAKVARRSMGYLRQRRTL
jgi:hypothetical protein